MSIHTVTLTDDKSMISLASEDITFLAFMIAGYVQNVIRINMRESPDTLDMDWNKVMLEKLYNFQMRPVLASEPDHAQFSEIALVIRSLGWDMKLTVNGKEM